MVVSQYVVEELINHGVTDTFGVPGGVILKFLAAMHERESEMTPHLSYHEQMAGFAACGYAQQCGKLGVAYATRGPGITNMITCIAEAYQESLPVLFITAHGTRQFSKSRFENNQELNIVGMVSSITKYAVSVDKTSEVARQMKIACDRALDKRMGPVLLDFSSALWSKEMDASECGCSRCKENDEFEMTQVDLDKVVNKIISAKRPVVLLGDGVRHAVSRQKVSDLAERIKMPIISSRGAQDLLTGSQYYFGYVGSHGTRYSNFILSKADVIVALGNRLAFPLESKSFAPIIKNAQIIRVDIDEEELNREIPGAEIYKTDVKNVVKYLLKRDLSPCNKHDWLRVCNVIRDELDEEDSTEEVKRLESFFSREKGSNIYVSDIGNNEFWVSRAFEKCRKQGTLLFSKSFGTLGVAIGRAIGAYYAARKPVICIMGDQGFQYNIQELQFIAQWKLPIKIVVINNFASGMIMDHEKKSLDGKLVHVNRKTGYEAPNIRSIANAYGIEYANEEEKAVEYKGGPLIYEIEIEVCNELIPNLPSGNECQKMMPLLERDLYAYLNNL